MRVLHTEKLYKNNKGTVGWWQVEALAEDREPTEGNPTPSAATVRITFAKTLQGKEVEKLDPIKGKNIGRANETSPSDQAIAEAKSRAEKQRDKGYVDTLEEATAPATNALGKKKPQLSLDILKFKGEIDWDTAYVQPKFDGHRAMQDEFLYSRNGKPMNVPHVTAELIASGLWAYPLDGEMYAHGINLQKIGSLIKKNTEESSQLAYWLFDIVSDAPFGERFEQLSSWYAEHSPNPDIIKLSPCKKVSNMAEAQAYVEEWEALGFEGGILHWGDEGYEDDARSVYSLKVKKFSDMEVEVTGYRFGTPNRYQGIELLNPILEYKTEDGKVGEVVAHGNQFEKDQIGRELQLGKHIGSKLTIKHFGFTNKGVPNIATAKCWYQPL